MLGRGNSDYEVQIIILEVVSQQIPFKRHEMGSAVVNKADRKRQKSRLFSLLFRVHLKRSKELTHNNALVFLK